MEFCLVQNQYLMHVNCVSSLDTFTMKIIVICGVIYVHISQCPWDGAVSYSSCVSNI